MKAERNPSIRINNISISNYKGIEHLDIEFPAPKMTGDPDILIIGSENGLGKTSVLECCCLLLYGILTEEKQFKFLQDRDSDLYIPDLLIRAGCHSAEICGTVAGGGKTLKAKLVIDRRGTVAITRGRMPQEFRESIISGFKTDWGKVVQWVCGITAEPVTENAFLLFHSYRKIQEGNPELGLIVDRDAPRRKGSFSMRHRHPASEFKLRILRSLMAKANLLEMDGEQQSPDAAIGKFNELVDTFVGGTITKLKPTSDNTMDFRVQPNGLDQSFSFDGLSSGQKEIISTLFTIWEHTRNRPCVVLVDEPELHLNAQWHREFVNSIISLVPGNQYIIATHSEGIMDSADENRRLLLVGDKG